MCPGRKDVERSGGGGVRAGKTGMNRIGSWCCVSVWVLVLVAFTFFIYAECVVVDSYVKINLPDARNQEAAHNQVVRVAARRQVVAVHRVLVEVDHQGHRSVLVDSREREDSL